MANELGFDINSAGLVQATNAVKDLDSATQKLGATAKTTNDVLNQTNAAVGKIGAGNSANMFKPMADGLAAVNKAVKDTAAIAPTMGQAIDAAITKSASGFKDFAAGVTAANGGLKTHVDAVEKAAEGHGHFSTQAMSAQHAARGFAEQVLYSGNVVQAAMAQVNHLSYAMTAEGGLVGAFGQVASTITGLPPAMALAAAGAAALGLAFVGLSVDFAKTNDAINQAKDHFAALTGSAAQGDEVYSKLRETAKGSASDFGGLSAAITKAMEGQNLWNSSSTEIVDGMGKLSETSVIYANSADRTSKAALGLGAVFNELAKDVHNHLGDMQTATAVQAALGESLGKTGNITADAFQKIRDASLGVARDIARAFHYDDINAFQAALAKSPMTVQQLMQALQNLKPQIDKNFGGGEVKTWAQGLDEVSRDWKALTETVAQTGVFDNVKTLFDAISRTINSTATDIKNLISIVQAASSAMDNIVTASKAAIGATANSAGGQGAGAGFGSDIASGVSSSGVDAANSIDYAGAVGDGSLPAFATGGTFTVGGTGGTDSQVVQFKATPGEVVTITPPGDSPGTSSGTPLLPATSGGSNADIAAMLQKQTDQIVAAINALNKNAGTAATVATSTGAAAGSMQSLARLQQVLGGGVHGAGGGGNSDGQFGSPWDLGQSGSGSQKGAARQQAVQSGPHLSNMGGDGIAGAATGTSIRGGFKSNTGVAQGPNVGKIPVNPDYTAAIAKAAKQAQETGDQNRGAIGDGADKTVSAVDSGAQKVAQAIEGSQSALEAGLAGIGNSFGAELAQALGDIGGGSGGSRGGGSGGSRGGGGLAGIRGGAGGFGADGVGGSIYGFSEGAGGVIGGSEGTGAQGTDAGAAGFDLGVSDIGGGINGGGYYQPTQGTDAGAGGFDIGTSDIGGGINGGGYYDGTDYAGGVADGTLPAFATGGSFIVGGSGGTDSKVVSFKATPGERVTISPPSIPGSGGGAISPSGISSPTGNDSSVRGSAPVQQTKIVNMYLHPGVQAEQFMRSRAQIARGLV